MKCPSYIQGLTSVRYFGSTAVTVISDIGQEVIFQLWKNVILQRPEIEKYFEKVVFLNLHLVLNSSEAQYRFNCAGARLLNQISYQPSVLVLIFSPIMVLRDAIWISDYGKKVRGLFVDAADTIFNSYLSVVRDELLMHIVANRSSTQWVYLWTAGDLNNLYQAVCRLDRRGLLSEVVLLSKQYFSGLTVEETIDDLSEQELEATYGIKTLKHYCVSN